MESWSNEMTQPTNEKHLQNFQRRIKLWNAITLAGNLESEYCIKFSRIFDSLMCNTQAFRETRRRDNKNQNTSKWWRISPLVFQTLHQLNSTQQEHSIIYFTIMITSEANNCERDQPKSKVKFEFKVLVMARRSRRQSQYECGVILILQRFFYSSESPITLFSHPQPHNVVKFHVVWAQANEIQRFLAVERRANQAVKFFIKPTTERLEDLLDKRHSNSS